MINSVGFQPRDPVLTVAAFNDIFTSKTKVDVFERPRSLYSEDEDVVHEDANESMQKGASLGSNRLVIISGGHSIDHSSQVRRREYECQNSSDYIDQISVKRSLQGLSQSKLSGAGVMMHGQAGLNKHASNDSYHLSLNSQHKQSK